MITNFNIGGGGGSKKDIEELKGRVNTLEGEYETLDTNKADKSEIPTKTSELENDSNFLTKHQSIKTINNKSIVGTGNVDLQTKLNLYQESNTDRYKPMATIGNRWGDSYIDFDCGANNKEYFGVNLNANNNLKLKADQKPKYKLSGVEHTIAFTDDIPTFKTINGETITGTGNIEIKGSEGAYVNIEGGEGGLVKIYDEDELRQAIYNGEVLHFTKWPSEAEGTFLITNTIIGEAFTAPYITMYNGDGFGAGFEGLWTGNSRVYVDGIAYHSPEEVGWLIDDDGNELEAVEPSSSVRFVLDDEFDNLPFSTDYNQEFDVTTFSKSGIVVKSVTATEGDLSVELAKKSDIESTNEKIAEKADITEFVSLRDRVEEIELFSTPNVTIVGNPTIKSGQVSGFNVNNYLKFPYLVHLHDKTFSIHFCMTTSDDITNQQNILDSEYGLAIAIRNGRFVLAMGSDGSTWDMGEHIGTHTIEANTTYHVKLSWDKSTYKLEFGDTMDDSGDVVYTLDIVVNDTKSLAAKEMFIGVGSDLTHIFGGSLNLNHCYLIMDGKVVWNGINGNLSTDLSNIDDDGKDVVKALAKQAQIVWYGTQEQYDALEDKTQFNIYLISE